MAQSFDLVYQFFEDADEYSAFLKRASVAVLAKAVALRDEAAPEPVTPEWVARQNWAGRVLVDMHGAKVQAARMLPGLVLIANDAGYLDDGSLDDVTDNQIVNALDDDFVDRYAGYVPDAP